MKINFDSIITKSFDNVLNQNSTKPQYFSYRKPNTQQSTFFTQRENDADLIFSKNPNLFSYKKNNNKPDIFKNEKKIQNHGMQEYFWFTSQIKEKVPKQNFTENKISIKKNKKTDIQSLTDRLTSPINKCHRKCGATEGSHQLKKNLKQFMEIQQPQKFLSNTLPNINFEDSLQQSSKTLSKSYKKQLHNRLYKQWITKQFRDNMLVEQYQRAYQIQNHSKEKESKQIIIKNARNSKSKSKSQSKDFKYVKFYDRLDELIETKKNRADYLKNHLSLGITKDGQTLFKPSIQKSMQTLNMGKNNYFKPKTIKNRQRKIQAPLHTRSLYQVNQTLNTSVESLERSIEIIQSREESFLKKIKNIFINKQTKIAEITPQRINKLTQVQFNLFFPLIQSLQSTQEDYNEKQFYKRIKSFYKNMNIKDRQQLRKHEIQITNSKKAKKIQLQKRSNIKNNRALDRQKFSVIKSFKDYHQTLKTFI